MSYQKEGAIDQHPDISGDESGDVEDFDTEESKSSVLDVFSGIQLPAVWGVWFAHNSNP